MRASNPRTSPVFLVGIGMAVGALIAGLTVPYVRTQQVATGSETTFDAGAGPGRGPADQAEAGTDGGTTGGSTGGSAGGTGGGTGGVAGGGDGGGPQAGTGFDVGVDAKSIKVGIAIIDIGAAKSLGFAFDLGDQRARYEALVAHQNAKGGINGRKIVADYQVIDAVSHPVESQQAACVRWTKDVKVFAVLVESTWSQAAAVCVTGQGNTPLFNTDGFDESYYANGLYYTTQASDNRILLDHANYLESKGRLKGKTIGVLVGEGSERLAVDKTLIPRLEQLGYKVKDVEVVPQTTSGTQKIPIAVSNFKAAGVDLVIVAAGVVIAGPFVQSASRSGYNPEYALSDFNNQINDQVATYYPDSFDGTVGISTHRFPEYRAGMPVPPADKACFDRVAKADPKVVPYQNSAHEVGLGECAIFDAFVNAATKAGANLSRATLRAGAESLGRFAIPSTQDGSFGPGKHDAVDFEREVVWRKSCKCWQLLPGAGVRRMG